MFVLFLILSFGFNYLNLNVLFKVMPNRNLASLDYSADSMLGFFCLL